VMLQQSETKYLHNNPDAYWCADCWKFTLDFVHLVEPLTSPVMKLQYRSDRTVSERI